MSPTPEKKFNFNIQDVQFGGNLINSDTINTTDISGNINNYSPRNKQHLAEAAAEIQQLLEQLDKINPSATQLEKSIFVTAEISQENKNRIMRALTAGGEKALEEFLKNPYVNVVMAIVKEWQNSD